MASVNIRRGLAFLLALALTLSVSPVPAWASEVDTEQYVEQSTEESTTPTIETESVTETQIATETESIEETQTTVERESVEETQAAEAETTSATEAPTEGQTSELLDSLQLKIDDILNWYLGSAEMDTETVYTTVAALDVDTYWNALIEIDDFENSAEVQQLSEAEAYILIENNPTFCGFRSALYERRSKDTSFSFFATTVSPVDGVDVIDSGGNGTVSGSTVTISFKGGTFGGTTNTITITNSSGAAKKITFTYSIENANSNSLGSNSGSKTYVLADGASESFTVTSKSAWYGNTNITLSGFVLEDVSSNINITATYDNSLGTVKVDGTAVTSGVAASANPASFTLTAEPKSGMEFVGWFNGDQLVSYNTSYPTSGISADFSVNAVFASPTASDAVFLVGNTMFTDLNSALTYANGDGADIVILIGSGVISSGTYNIPSGITLLIPYAHNTSSFTSPNTDPERAVSVGDQATATSAFRTLTLAQGAIIDCSGLVRVDARQASNSTRTSGQVYGTYGKIVLNEGAELNMNSDSALRAYGYITGAGTVNASKANIYELFQMTDWRGGNNTSSIYESLEGQSFLVSQYYVQNIEAKLVIDSNSKLTTLVTIAAGLGDLKSEYSNPAEMIGSSGLFVLSSGSTITRTYSSAGRIQYSVNGNLTVGSITLKVKSTLASITLNSSDYVLNLPSNMTIKIESGITTIPVRVKLLPGTILQIDSGAELSMSSGAELIIYDNDDWKSGAYTYTGNFFPVQYAVSGKLGSLPAGPGQLIVNGTLTVEDGAAVYSTNQTGTTGNNGLSGSGTITIGTAPTTVRTTITEVSGSSTTTVDVSVTPLQALLKGISTSASDYTHSMAHGKTYHGCGSNYWYNFAVNANNAANAAKINVTSTLAKATGDTLLGYVTYDTAGQSAFTFALTDQCSSVEGMTATDGAYSLTNVTGDTTITLSANHTEVVDAAVAATCTTDGLTEGKHCSVCNSVTVVQEVVPAPGHTWVAADCDTPKTCSVCGATEGEALGHSYNAVVTAPTCTAEGYTTYTCSNCGDSYTADEVEATGHNYESSIIKSATCTEDGQEKFTCANCSDSYTETIKATGHTPGTDATCTTDQTCNVCGTTITAALEHDYESIVTAPTCNEDGYTTYTCSRCDHSYTGDNTTATGHSYDNGVVTTDPTCTAEGVKTFTCETCGNTYTEEVEAPGHTEVVDAAVAPTCTKTGLTEGKHCSVCDKTLVAQEEVPVIAHNCESVVTNPTCQAAGYTTHTCTVCGYSYTDSEVAALGHNYGEWQVKTAATCTTDGEERRDCTRCTAYETNLLSASGHSYKSVVADPTCTEAGYTTYTCSACGDSYVGDEVAALGHTAGKAVTENKVDSTCTTDGSYDTVTYCTVCGVETSRETITVPATGHTEETIPAVDATCTETGLTAGVKCSVCGTVITAQTEVPMLEHSYNEGVVTTAPTCTEDGVKTFTCRTCGDTYTEVVAAAGHTEEEIPAVAATCTATGLTAGVKCSVCGEIITSQTVVDALGHAYDEGVVTTEPTCTEAGVKTFTCGTCGDTYTEAVAAAGHTEEEIPTVDATCTETGLTAGVKCSACGETLTAQEEIPATGHDYESVVTNPTCTEAGYTTYTCKECGHSYTDDEMTAFGHSYEDAVTAPTCVDAGYTTHTCSNCGDSYKDSEVAATGEHTYVDGVCSGCGAEEPQKLFKLYGANMTLGNALDMNFAIKMSDITDPESYAVITRTYSDGRTYEENKLPLSDWDDQQYGSAGLYLIIYDGIAAKEMCDTITVTIYDSTGKQISEPWVDGIRAYAMRSFDNFSSKFKTLFVEMLNYGAEAQKSFNYNTADLANSQLSEAQKTYGLKSVDYVNKAESDQSKYIGTSLVLENSIEMQMGFKNISASMHAVVSFTDHYGEKHETTVSGSEFVSYGGSTYAVVIDGLVVADARQMVTVTIYNGEAEVTYAIDSIESYVSRMSSSSGLYEAILKFADAAYNTFH